MDIVYPVIRTRDDNLELRYSLRSLKNIKHNKVFIIWYKPKWVKNVIHIEYDDKNWRWQNVIDKYRIACNDSRISDDFIWMMDDVFILEKITNIPYYKMCNIKDYLDYLEVRWIKGNWYYQAMEWLLEYYPEWDCFDTHTPIIYNKDKLNNIIEKYWWLRGSKRSLYCNEYWLEWIYWNFPDYKDIWSETKIDDCKCYNSETFKIIKWQKYLSSNYKTIKNKKIKKYMDTKFNKQSKYEILKYNYNNMDKVKVLFIKWLCPYRKWDIGMIRRQWVEQFVKKWRVKVIKEKQNKSMANRIVETKIETKEIKDYSKYTKNDLMEELDKKNIEYKKSMRKDILIDLLK